MAVKAFLFSWYLTITKAPELLKISELIFNKLFLKMTAL